MSLDEFEKLVAIKELMLRKLLDTAYGAYCGDGSDIAAEKAAYEAIDLLENFLNKVEVY